VKLHFLLAALFLSALSASEGAQSATVRPDIRQADQVETQTGKNIPPPVLALCAAPLSSQRGLDEPPGKLEIAKHPLVLERPGGPRPPSMDVAKLHQDAIDLAQLAQSVPTDVDQAAQGKLPKDLAQKLKRIEKLSKRLRGELAP
jgi:hypothetical protein